MMEERVKYVVRLAAVFFCLLGASCLLTGCATRLLALKEYQAYTAKNPKSPLQGKSVYVGDFSMARAAKGANPSADPVGYVYHPFTDTQKAAWDKDVRALSRSVPSAQWLKVGVLRTVIYVPRGPVYTLTPPERWMKEGLEFELKQQGAKLVADQGDADLIVSGKITFIYVDQYGVYWADLMADVVLQPKGGTSVTEQIHTSANIPARTERGFDYYEPLRMCQQKMFSILLPKMEHSIVAE